MIVIYLQCNDGKAPLKIKIYLEETYFRILELKVRSNTKYDCN